MKIIVGLGNPGKQYENTYHNVGFSTVDKLCEKLNASFSIKPKLKGEIAEALVDGEKIIIVKPQTFMNNSGECVRAVIDFYKASLSDLLIVYDDLDIDAGTQRFREKGSAGTHNGMRNIVLHLGSGDFARARIGTKPDNASIPIISYVLMKIPKERAELIGCSENEIVDLALDFIKGMTSEKIMCKYNGKK